MNPILRKTWHLVNFLKTWLFIFVSQEMACMFISYQPQLSVCTHPMACDCTHGSYAGIWQAQKVREMWPQLRDYRKENLSAGPAECRHYHWIKKYLVKEIRFCCFFFCVWDFFTLSLNRLFSFLRIVHDNLPCHSLNESKNSLAIPS